MTALASSFESVAGIELRPYANAKGNLRFPWDQIPYSLIARVARALAREIAAPVGRQKQGE